MSNTKEIYQRFLGVGYTAYMDEEIKRLKNNLQDLKNDEKNQINFGQILNDFADCLIETGNKLLYDFEYPNIYYELGKMTFEFFQNEEKTKPLAEVKDPYQIKSLIIKIFLQCYAWVCFNLCKNREDREEHVKLRKKIELKIKRIINLLE